MSSTTTRDKAERQAEALARATGRQSLMNWPAIIEGFVAKGIPEDEILPRVNVFTFNAWRALGRTVKRGEHGVKVLTWIPVGTSTVEAEAAATKGEKTGKARCMPRSATVFHISQTVPLES